MKTYKGIFKPKNPQKYKGDPSKIVWRSSWELVLMRHLDSHPDIIEWASEEFSIPYRSPIDNKLHRYFPDFWIKKRTKTGKIEVDVIEVKPNSQTKPPKIRRRITPSYINEVKTWGVNEAKWAAAREFCEDRKWNFVIMDELGLVRVPFLIGESWICHVNL